jgi:hypothetical protein
MIPIGKSNGIFAFNNMVKEDKNIPKMKDEVRDLNMGALRNDKSSMEKQ